MGVRRAAIRVKQRGRVACLSCTVPEPIPQVRVVRHAGQVMTPPPAPRPASADADAGYLRTALAYAIGLWPLTCVVLLVAGLLVVTANLGTP